MYEYTSIIYLASAYTLLDILQLYSKQRCLIKPRDIDAACDWWLPPRVRDLLTGHNARWPQFYYGNMFKEPLVCSCWFISSPSGLFGLVTWNMRVNCNLGYKQFLQHLKILPWSDQQKNKQENRLGFVWKYSQTWCSIIIVPIYIYIMKTPGYLPVKMTLSIFLHTVCVYIYILGASIMWVPPMDGL